MRTNHLQRDDMPELRKRALEDLLRGKVPVQGGFGQLIGSASPDETHDGRDDVDVYRYMPDFQPPHPW